MHRIVLLIGLLLGGAAGCDKEPTAEETGPPVLTVTAPVHGAAINGTMRIEAECTGNCRSITVRTAEWAMNDEEILLAEGGRSIARDVSVAPLLAKDRYPRSWERLIVTATASTGETDTEVLDVFIFDAPAATEVLRTPGPVLDFDGTRALYAEQTGDQWHVRLGSGNPAADQLLRTGGRPAYGVIVGQDAALFTVWRNSIRSGATSYRYIIPETSDADSLFEWRNGTITLLSATSNTRRPLVEDGLVAWQEGVRESGSFNPPARMPLQVRDLATGTTTTLTTTSTREGIDLGAGRTVVWTENVGTGYDLTYQVVRWREGAVTRFAADPASNGNTMPKTDGNLVAFRTYSCCQVELEGPAGRAVLAQFERPAGSSYASPSYDVAAGFVAYTGGSGYEVRLRRPDGSSVQVGTVQGGDRGPLVQLVGDAGAVMFGDRLALPGGVTRALGSDLVRVVERNGAYYVLYGNAVFKLS